MKWVFPYDDNIGFPRYSHKELDECQLRPGVFDFSKTNWPEDEKWKWRAVDSQGFASYFMIKPKITHIKLNSDVGFWIATDEGEKETEEFSAENIAGTYEEWCGKYYYLEGSWENKNWKNSLEKRP